MHPNWHSRSMEKVLPIKLTQKLKKMVIEPLKNGPCLGDILIFWGEGYAFNSEGLPWEPQATWIHLSRCWSSNHGSLQEAGRKRQLHPSESNLRIFSWSCASFKTCRITHIYIYMHIIYAHVGSRISLHILTQKTKQSSNLSPKNKGHLLNPKGKKIKQGAWRWFPGRKSVLENSWPQWPCWCCTSVDAEGERLKLYIYPCLLKGDEKKYKISNFCNEQRAAKTILESTQSFWKTKIEVSAIRKSLELSFRFLYPMISGSTTMNGNSFNHNAPRE